MALAWQTANFSRAKTLRSLDSYLGARGGNGYRPKSTDDLVATLKARFGGPSNG